MDTVEKMEQLLLELGGKCLMENGHVLIAFINVLLLLLISLNHS